MRSRTVMCSVGLLLLTLLAITDLSAALGFAHCRRITTTKVRRRQLCDQDIIRFFHKFSEAIRNLPGICNARLYVAYHG